MVVLVLTKKKGVVFLVVQMVSHNSGKQINRLGNFILGHPGNEDRGKPLFAEKFKKRDN
jgi:hypothetical protein